MTGTPIQNRFAELFSLMNFLEPQKFDDRKKWEAQCDKKYREHTLTADDIKELHERLRPHFLRRTKSVVLKDLPSKFECLVPVSMTVMQRELYKAVFMKNIRSSGSNSKSYLQVSKLANIMMELRKICVHPFLLPNVEKESQSDQETNDLFIQSSPKLQLLKTMCRQLKAGNHRVLIFTQFKDGLSVLEDSMEVEGYRCCRMDGDTPISERQAMIDKFNAERSEIFAFLLTTRTGGVGINLMTADTVIIYDADWNPQQGIAFGCKQFQNSKFLSDLQGMARAHRIGETKPVAVYMLFTKNTIEEKMSEVGKRKLIMDHVIAESMKDEAENKSDLTSVLKFAAEKLFNEESGDATEPRIIYDEPSVKMLLDLRQDSSGPDGEKSADGGKENGAGSFSFARVWTLDGSAPIDNTEAENLLEEINLATSSVREELNSANDEADLLEVLKRVRAVENDGSDQLVVAGKTLRKRAPIEYAENQSQTKRKKLTDAPVSLSEPVINESDWEVSHDSSSSYRTVVLGMLSALPSSRSLPEAVGS
ncbi:P-loop containing nucleoside triphosphate hydrolase protein [Cladochytrium replicatum]|nr:P-loop containing nucleoside triphosphate hydrolase protein [Cladochytrium replicatum]